jgi:hypothetical protein
MIAQTPENFLGSRSKLQNLDLGKRSLTICKRERRKNQNKKSKRNFKNEWEE